MQMSKNVNNDVSKDPPIAGDVKEPTHLSQRIGNVVAGVVV